MTAGAKGERKYDPHPAGSFMAVCRDIYKDKNQKYGQMNAYGKPEPEFKIRFEFLTEEPIEIGGKLLPRFISRNFPPSWHDESNLRKFVRLWDPAMGRSEKADLEALVGRGAYLTIVQEPDKKDPAKVWSNINGIAPAPRGASIPAIPADFVRHRDKEQQPAQASAAAAPVKASPEPVAQADNEDDLPF